MTRSVSIEVPASTSNVGGGFDCVGIALDIWMRAGVWMTDGGSRRTESLLERGFRAACPEYEGGIAYDIVSDIPIARGLGSSAAATMAGAHAANQLLGLGLGDDALCAIGRAIEGHPDNVAAVVHGGAVLVAGDLVTSLDVHPGLALVLAVPGFAVHTSSARSILPKAVTHDVAAAAAARGAALVRGLANGDPAVLGFALDDVLHVPFRRRLLPGYAEVTDAAREAGAIGATLSGSGSSILAIATPETAARAGVAMQGAWLAHGIQSTVLHPSILREFACR
jgi:homoserine kinase